MKNVTITIDGETHELVYTESDGIRDCELCSLQLVCNEFNDPICKLSGTDPNKSYYFERSTDVAIPIKWK